MNRHSTARSVQLAKSPVALAIGALACLPWPAAWAQSSATPDVQSVVISGTKRAQLEQQATQSVTVLTPEELAGEFDAFGALIRLPNVSTVSRGQLPVVRGVDGSGVATGSGAAISGGRPRFTTYVDGVARGHSFNPDGSASIWDLKQIEVYRGAQSTTLGRNASAGGMVITKIGRAHV